MNETVRVNATMSRSLLERVDAFAAARLEDRSTAIRQLVDFALREMAKREALEAYQGGRVTLRELGRALGLDAWATEDLLAAEGVAVAQGAREETKHALEEVLSPSGGARGRRRAR